MGVLPQHASSGRVLISASRREAEAAHQAHGSSKPQVILGVAFLAVAIGLAVALHLYGDRLLG